MVSTGGCPNGRRNKSEQNSTGWNRKSETTPCLFKVYCCYLNFLSTLDSDIQIGVSCCFSISSINFVYHWPPSMFSSLKHGEVESYLCRLFKWILVLLLFYHTTYIYPSLVPKLDWSILRRFAICLFAIFQFATVNSPYADSPYVSKPFAVSPYEPIRQMTSARDRRTHEHTSYDDGDFIANLTCARA